MLLAGSGSKPDGNFMSLQRPRAVETDRLVGTGVVVPTEAQNASYLWLQLSHGSGCKFRDRKANRSGRSVGKAGIQEH